MSDGLIKSVGKSAIIGTAIAGAVALTPLRGVAISYLSKTPTGFFGKAGQTLTSGFTGITASNGVVNAGTGHMLKNAAKWGAIGGGVTWGMGKVMGGGQQQAAGPHTQRILDERSAMALGPDGRPR